MPPWELALQPDFWVQWAFEYREVVADAMEWLSKYGPKK